MLRIVPISILVLVLATGTAAAQIERNPHSRSEAGVEKHEQPSETALEPPVLSAATAAAISAAQRKYVANSIASAARGAAGQALALASPPLEARKSAAAGHSDQGNHKIGRTPPASAEQETKARSEHTDNQGMKAQSAPAVPAADDDHDAGEGDKQHSGQSPAADSPSEPLESLDELAAALNRREQEPNTPVQIKDGPVVDASAEKAAEPSEPTEAASEPTNAEPALEGEEAQDPASESVDTRRPDLKLRIRDHSDHGDTPASQSVDDQLLLDGREDSETSGDSEPDADSEDAVTDRDEPAAGADEWVRAAPPERARPPAPARHWDLQRTPPPPPPTESEQPPAPDDEPDPASPPAELPPAGNPGAAGIETSATVAFLAESDLEKGLLLAPLPRTGSDLGAARAPVEPEVGDFAPHMPDFTISDRIRTVSRGNSRRKQVALTFDDGPHPEFTSQILAVLDYYDVPATFFFVGVQAQKYPHWVKMVNQAGHEIGSHTYDHFRLPKMPRQEKIYQIDEYQRLVEGLTGVTPRFLRPPGGQVDAETEQLLADRHMVLALWDVALNDTHEDKTSEMILTTANRKIRAGSVVLLHDGIQATVDMLPELITRLKAQGFEFVTMSELASGM